MGVSAYGFHKGPPPKDGSESDGHSECGGSESSHMSGSEASGRDVDPHSPGGTPPPSDEEVMGIDVLVGGDIEPPHDVVDKMPDDVPHEPAPPEWEMPPPPAFGLGVECAEVASSGRSKCMACGAGIDFKSIRFKVWCTPKVFRFMHTGCFAGITPAHRDHSIACLRHQAEWQIGLDEHAIRDAINNALA